MALSPEIYLLSSIVLRREFTVALAEGVTTEMFHTCQDEFDWIAKYHAKHRKEPSKAAFVRAFPNFRVKDVDDTKHFVEEVRKSHARQEMTVLMRDQADLIAEGKVSEAAELGMSGITRIAAGMGAHEEVDALNDWKPMYDEVRARKALFDEFGMAGIPTGFETLDERTGGVGRGQSWIVAARLGEGKSFKMLQMTAAAILAGKRVHFAALEMSRAEVTMRLHNLLSSSVGAHIFQSTQLAQGKDFDLKLYRKFLDDLPKKVSGHLTVSDTRGLGSMEIASQIERNRPDLYMLDYLTLGKMKGDGGWQDIGRFSKDIKEMAGRYDIGMVSAAQLNRNGTDKDAGAETIGGSDQIGQDADAVIVLKKMSTRMTEMRLVKYRHGKSGYKWFSFLDLETGVFNEVSKDRALEIADIDKSRADDELNAEPPKRKSVVASIQAEGLQNAAYSTPGSARKRPLRKVQG